MQYGVTAYPASRRGGLHAPYRTRIRIGEEPLLSKKPPFRDRPASERLALAKARADKLVHHIVPLFLMHEANALIIYSQQLSGQIPRSRAAHAFNQFQRSMHLFEIIRLCAIWDKPSEDRESIPTIIALLDDPALIDQLAREAYAFHSNEASSDGFNRDDNAQQTSGKSWWRQDRQSVARQVEEGIRQKLSFAIEEAAKIQKSLRLKALMDFRHRNIAHNLDLPEPDMKLDASVAKVKYGDEGIILKNTVAVADALHHGLNETAFDWNGSREIARMNARALWDSCTFQIQTRPPLSAAPR